MKMSSIRKKVIKRYERLNHDSEYQDIGTLIKERRKELNLTQETISNGICSISYLSKIENNQISPNEFFVREIMEKMEVEDSIYRKTLEDKNYLEKMIDHIFYNNQKLSEDIYNDIEDCKHNLVLNIAKLGYIVHHNMWDDDQYVMMLENLVQNMDDYELKAYLLFAIMYNVSNNMFKNAYDLYLTFSHIPLVDDKIDALGLEYAYMIFQELKICLNSFSEYETALALYLKHSNYKRATSLRLLNIESLLYNDHNKALEELEKISVNILDEYDYDRYHLAKARIVFKKNSYKESAMILSNIGEKSFFYYDKMILLYEVCLKEEDEDMISQISKIIDSLPHDKTKIKSKIYYHYLLQDSRQDQKEYLREIAIPFSVKVGDINSLAKYTDDIMNVCIDASRYKEAMMHYRKYKKEVEKIYKLSS